MQHNENLIAAVQSVARAAGADGETITRLTVAARGNEPLIAEKYIPTKAAAAILETCGATVFRYERAGKLHGIRRSKRCIRWRKTEVERLAMNGAANA